MKQTAKLDRWMQQVWDKVQRPGGKPYICMYICTQDKAVLEKELGVSLIIDTLGSYGSTFDSIYYLKLKEAN